MQKISQSVLLWLARGREKQHQPRPFFSPRAFFIPRGAKE